MVFSWKLNRSNLYTGESLQTYSDINGGHHICNSYWEFVGLPSNTAVRVDNQNKTATPAKREIPPRFDLVGQGQGDVLPQDV